ncbi:aminoglycoside adenylyltransferase domain-containing protein [Deinococcus sp.]|uniref:aminoglycoside adenylyltransferase domain-containing protein n=1 Tax=Deinococcus sp. TaxID=47478 RepID=UPI0025DB3AAD|nr:aminoglycoside adenylyltransferase domain-containing protein [Deinococcus sp.]
MFLLPLVGLIPNTERNQSESVLLDSLRWHRQHEQASANSVLNACRSWRWAQTGVWGSKRAGLSWVLEQPLDQPNVPEVLRQAEHARQTGERLNLGDAAAFLSGVEEWIRAEAGQ